MEKKIKKYIDILRGTKSLSEIKDELIALSYFVNETKKYKTNYSKVDFSSREQCGKDLSKILSSLKNGEESIVKDIMDSGIIYPCKELEEVFKDMLDDYNLDSIDFVNVLNDTTNHLLGRELSSNGTVSEISTFVYNVFKNKKTKKVLDLCSGEGNFLFDWAQKDGTIEYYGAEINLRNILISRIKLSMVCNNYYNFLTNVLTTQMLPEYDIVFSNFPWMLKYNGEISFEKDSLLDYSTIKNRMEWAFVFKSINSLKENGKAIVIMPNGGLYNSIDKISRKQIIDKKLLESIIAMPEGTLLGTSVGYSILVFSKNNTEVKFVDGRECSIPINKFQNKIDTDKLSNLYLNDNNSNIKKVNYSEIVKKDYVLSVNNYVNKLDISLTNPVVLGDYAEILAGYQYSVKTVEELKPKQGNIDVIKITNINETGIDEENLSSINVETDTIEKYYLKENDIVISTKGTNIKVALIKNLRNKKTIVNGNLSVIRLLNKKINPIYLYCFLNSELGKQCLEMIQTGGVIINISKNALLRMEVPLSEEDIQETIANRYLLLNEKENKLEQELQNVKNKINNLFEEVAGE